MTSPAWKMEALQVFRSSPFAALTNLVALAVISTASKYLHNDLEEAIKALAQKNSSYQPGGSSEEALFDHLESVLGTKPTSRLIPNFPAYVGYADGLFVMTTATEHKNNLNRSSLKKNKPRSLRVETIANSAGGTAQVALVAQPGIGFLNGRFNWDGSPTEDTEDCLGRITVGLTRSQSLTVLVSPRDMLGLIGMAQVLAAVAYGIKGVRRGRTT